VNAFLIIIGKFNFLEIGKGGNDKSLPAANIICTYCSDMTTPKPKPGKMYALLDCKIEKKELKCEDLENPFDCSSFSPIT
jgi:hypothetical protein